MSMLLCCSTFLCLLRKMIPADVVTAIISARDLTSALLVDVLAMCRPPRLRRCSVAEPDATAAACRTTTVVTTLVGPAFSYWWADIFDLLPVNGIRRDFCCRAPLPCRTRCGCCGDCCWAGGPGCWKDRRHRALRAFCARLAFCCCAFCCARGAVCAPLPPGDV